MGSCGSSCGPKHERDAGSALLNGALRAEGDGKRAGYRPLDLESQSSAPARGSFCTSCSICAVALGLVLATFAAILVVDPPPLPSRRTKIGEKPSKTASEFFLVDDLTDHVPQPPEWYPEHLKGVFWLDHWGDYGESGIKIKWVAQDAVMSFGDTALGELDREARTQYLSVSGPSWVWLNNLGGLNAQTKQQHTTYFFQWNKDYSQARIWLSEHKYGRNWFGLGPTTETSKWLEKQYWMIKMPDPPEGACPPAANATKEERSLCAAFKRVTCHNYCLGSYFGYNLPVNYYLFKVADKDGRKREPYFGALRDTVKARNQPNATAAAENNVTLGKLGMKTAVLLHGTY